jgi:hypothetical protein
MTAEIEQCCQFTVQSILVENGSLADEILLVTASFRHSALFHASATILKSGSVT